jgi:uncharacterized protein DUF3658
MLIFHALINARSGQLVSAPISYFDPLLMSHVTPQFQKAALIVGKALADIWDSSYIQTGDLVLAARLRALADAGAVESRGDLLDIRHIAKFGCRP